MSAIETQLRNGQWDSLVQTLEDKWQTEEATAQDLFYRAIAAMALQDYATSYEYAVNSFELDGENSELSEMLASLCVLTGRIKESYFYRKNLSTLERKNEIKELIPFGVIPEYTDTLQTATDAPLLDRAKEASNKMEWQQAEHWFLQHIAFNMKDPIGHMELARCQIKQERYRTASETLKGARALFPANASLASLLGETLVELGEFAQAQASFDWAKDMAPTDERIHAAAIRSMLRDPQQSVPKCIQELKDWYQEHISKMESAFAPKDVGEREKLTIGILISAMDRSRIAPLVGEIFSWHDPAEFHMIGYGEGEVTYLFNRYFKSAFVEWRDVGNVDAMTLRNMFIADGIDILIDMSGLNSIETLKCFGSRCAPIQISWNETQLSAFLPEFDHVVASNTYPELESKRISFPISNQVYAKRDALEKGDRTQRNKFTFIADVSLADLTYETISLWAKILLTNPNSILLLRSHDFYAEDNSKSLIERFGLFGIAQRVDIIQESDRRNFFLNGDLVLLPAHGTTADVIMDALSAGIAVLGCEEFDIHFSSGIQILKDLNLSSHMLTQTKEQFFATANTLCTDQIALETVIEAGQSAFTNSPVFDPKERMNAIAQTLHDLWKKHKPNE
jgi:predicted O-linked N-acetylglucosamine transferase (SPINDLY family)